MNLSDLHCGKMNNSFLINLSCFEEMDGILGTFETDAIPGFVVKRMIYIYDVPEGAVRANHACMNASLVFIAMAGSVQLEIECEGVQKKYMLGDNRHAIYVPPASWVKAYDFTSDAILVVLSDVQYRNCNYVNNYSEYRKMIGDKK
ncbi:MAG: hypothetical protein E7278_02170 [Lachnospiraceae bacterium]|jgi:hypothetical protein|nr:hypothetical protein [Lachnospiraceae bacterium]